MYPIPLPPIAEKPNQFSYPEMNMVTYEFPGTKYTADTLKWVWYDGIGADKQRQDLMLPGGELLHDQGAHVHWGKGPFVPSPFSAHAEVDRRW